MFRGLLPYRDFFEHHTPWYYLALSPFFRWFAVDQSFESAMRFLSFGRGLSLALTALSVGLLFAIGRLGANRRVGLLAGLFLVAQPVVIQKTLEIRPDVPALPFFLGGLWFLLRGLQKQDEDPPTRTLGWFLGGGLCLGAAIMCTQKMLFVLPGAFAGLGLLGAGRWPANVAPSDQRGRDGPRGHRRSGGVDVGLPSPFRGAAINSSTTTSSSIRNGGCVRIGTCWSRSKPAGPCWSCVSVGASVAMLRFYRAKQRQYGEVLLLCTLGGLIAGIAIVPAAYKQYYLMPLPIACVFAAKGLVWIVEMAQERVRRRLFVGATVLILIWPGVELKRSFARRDDRQTARLRYVFEHTGPADAVLDGWLGTQVFRPHPLYYAFMHRELRRPCSRKPTRTPTSVPWRVGGCGRRSSRWTTSCWPSARVS